MFFRANTLRSDNRGWHSRTLVLLGLTSLVLIVTGCDQLSRFGVTQVEAKTGEDSIEAFLTYQDVLIGKHSDAVVEVFGKPKGIFEKRQGTVWMYSRWRVEFDTSDNVVRMERDVASTGSGGSAGSQSMALAARPKPTPARVVASGGITKVSNGGQPVDLKSLMPAGKITVVDFYADWCGPCRKVAPHLEKLASENLDVVLVKVDIVKWGTPVTEQYDINSVPNMRVYDRSQKQVGKATSSFSQIQSYVEKAGS